MSPQLALIPSPANASALPINRIRAVVRRTSDQAVEMAAHVNVSPTATAWTIELRLGVSDESLEVVLELALLHVAADGSESAQFSGRSAPLTVRPGVVVSPDLDVARGPPANLSVTGVTITSGSNTMLVGAGQTLGASATTSDGSVPEIFWTSLDSMVAQAVGSTVTGRSPGIVDIVASAGAFADTVTLTVYAVLGVSTSTLPGGVQAAAYSQTLAATGGAGPYTWAVPVGGLPPGVTLTTAGALTGTPTVAGTYNFVVQVSSGDGQVATRPLSITVHTPLVLNTTTLQSGVLGDPYSSTLSATGGVTPYAWSLLSGTLPSGLNLSAAGSISGTPTAVGTSSFAVGVASADGQTAQRSLSITVNDSLTVTTSSLPYAIVDSAYSVALQATGGVGPYAWTVPSGTWPAGLTLATNGAITGTPVASGSDSFTVQVASSDGQTAQRALSIGAYDRLNIPPTTLPTAVVSAAYSVALTVDGGLAPYTWSIASGSLPGGITLTPAGTITGVPTGAGIAGFTVQSTSTDGQTTTQALTLSVFSPLAIGTSSLPNGVTGTPYSTTLPATGGLAPLVWSIVSGTLPAGLTLSGSGALTGTPGTAGSSSITVQVASADGQTAQLALTLTINATLTITTTSLPGASYGVPYVASLTSTGGAGPYTWSVVSGSLPAGISLSSVGDLSGAPTALGTSNFSVQVSSSDSQTDNQALSIDVALMVLAPTDLCSSYPPESIATFGDANLEAAVRLELATPTAPLTCLEVALVPRLTASNVGSLSGAQNLTALSYLRAGPHSIVDLSPLAGLTGLDTLDLANDVDAPVTISSLAPLTALTTLSYLNLDRAGGVVSLTPLGGLTNLRDLYLRANAIVDISPLASLTTLQRLDLGSNAIADVSPLSGLTGLTSLDLSGNVIAGVSALSSLTSLSGALWLSDNRVTDLTPLGGLVSLTAVYAADNDLTNIAGLATLPSLAVVDLRNNPTLSNVSPLISNLALGLGDFVDLANTLASCADVATLQARGVSVSQSCVLPPVVVTTTSLPGATVGLSYSATLAATGGSGVFTWTVASGTLPAGLSLSSSGTLSGTALSSGTSTFAVRAASGLQMDIQALTLTVASGTSPVILAPTQFCSQYAPTAIATFADVALEGLVRDTLLIAAPTPLTCADLSGITNLGGDEDVAELAGIQNLTNLQVLDLDNAGVGDLTFLGTLTALTSLDLTDNVTTGLNLAPLAGLVSLTALELEENAIWSIAPLAGLTQLRILRLSDNSISDITALSGLSQLEILDLSENAISDIGALAGLTQLQILHLGRNAVSDLTALAGLTQLTELALWSNLVTDLAPLAGLSGLSSLDVSNNRITDLGPLAGVTGLDTLSAGMNEIASVSALAGLTGLSSLGLSYNLISDVTALVGLTDLVGVNLGSNPALSSVGALISNTGIGTGDAVGISATLVPCSEVTLLQAKGAFVGHTCGTAPFLITTTTLPGGGTGMAYSASLTATGGTTPYTWDEFDDALPPGLVLSSAGSITGVPSLPGTYAFTVFAFSPGFGNTSRTFTITIGPGTPNILGRWVDASGNAITSAAVGQQVRLQICSTRADIAAFQASIQGFASGATAVSVAGFDSGAASGVHPACAGTLDVLNVGTTSSGLTDPITALVTSGATIPGVGPAGIFEITLNLTSAGVLSVDIDPASIIAVDFNGAAVVLTPDIADLPVS